MEQRISLAGSRVLVTGAASGIGAAVVRAFQAAGAEAIGLDVRPGNGILARDVGDDRSWCCGPRLMQAAARELASRVPRSMPEVQ